MNLFQTIRYNRIYPDLDAYIRDNKEPESDIRYSLPIYDSRETEEDRLKRWLEQNHTTSFQQDLLEWINRRHMTEVQFYNAALIDRKLFSTIRNNIYYIPSRDTALACCLALQLNLSDAEALLRKAGFCLSHTSTSDLIIEYCILHRMFNLDDVNMLLDHYNERSLRV